jgi:hypothetical protein
MLLSAKAIINWCNVNMYTLGNNWTINVGDPITLYFQILDTSQAISGNNQGFGIFSGITPVGNDRRPALSRRDRICQSALWRNRHLPLRRPYPRFDLCGCTGRSQRLLHLAGDPARLRHPFWRECPVCRPRREQHSPLQRPQHAGGATNQ